MGMRDWVKALAVRVGEVYASCLAISPVFLGILFPMVFYASFLLIFYPSISWFLADPSLFWGSVLNSYLLGYVVWYIPEPAPLIALEVVVFAVGLGIFVVSLAQLVWELKKGSRLVQNGMYRHIRHPQHLGLIIMVLPLTLYIPGTPDLGIRIGDIVSWIQFVFLMAVFSDWEDYRLMKKFPDSYPEYYERTGLLIPKGLLPKWSRNYGIFHPLKRRYALFIVLYILVLLGLALYYVVGVNYGFVMFYF